MANNLGGGPYNGYVTKQTNNVSRDSGNAMARRILRDSWNHAGALGVDNGHNRVVTPFRGVMNMGDFLGRQNYVCGGPPNIIAISPGTATSGLLPTAILQASPRLRAIPSLWRIRLYTRDLGKSDPSTRTTMMGRIAMI